MPTTQKEDYSFVQFSNFYPKVINHFCDLHAPWLDGLIWEVPSTKGYIGVF
jgi:hypothetical protein